MIKRMSPYSLKSDRLEFAKKIWRSIPYEQRKKLKSGSSGVLLRNAHQFLETSRSIPNYGLLTVIIPVYNVQEYLEECVLSVVGQTYRRLQILLVDDGSTDDSLRIARRLALTDHRIRIITKQNNGLGAARNTGVAAAKGRFIAFVDSDDIVPRRAYEKMLGTLNETGSDFVVGSIYRLQEKTRTVPKWAQEVHAEDRLKLTLDQYPDILHNVFAWNKIFKKEFWDETLRSFPEGVLYEDQEITAKAYAEATSFDVLKTIVYDWRIRSDRSSITQQKDNIVDLTDRLLVTERVNEYLTESVDSNTYDFWLTKVLGTDLAQYYIQVPRASEEYWATLQQSVSGLLKSAGAGVIARISVHERLLLECIRNNNRGEFESIVYYNAENGRSYPIDIEGSQLLARPGYLRLLEETVPAKNLEVDVSDLQVFGELSRVSQNHDNLIEIVGYAYIPGINTHKNGIVPEFHLINTLTGKSQTLKHVAEIDEYIDINGNDAWTSYAESGFRVTIDPDEMEMDSEQTPAGTEWRLSLVFKICGAEVEGKLSNRKVTGAAAIFPLFPVVSGNGRWICRHSQVFGLSFIRENYKRQMNKLQITGRQVSFDVEVPENEVVQRVVVECKKLRISASSDVSSLVSGTGSARFTVELPEIPRSANDFVNYTWSIRAVSNYGVAHDLAWTEGHDRHAELTDRFERLRFQTSGLGYVQLSDRKWGVRAEQWSVDSDSETVSVVVGFASEVPLPDFPHMIFANGRSRIVSAQQTWIEKGVRAEYVFPLKSLRWNMYHAAAESGTYSLRCVTADSKGRLSDHWTEVASGAQGSLPDYFSTPSVNLTFARTPQAAALSLRIGPPLHLSERGKLMQGRLQRRISEWTGGPIYRGAVLFESFAGKTIGDSSLAIFTEMVRANDPRPKYWSIRDHSVVVPAGAKALVMYSEEWYKVLHTAEYVVNNNNFPFFYRKHQEQKYVQVWHGTPLKKIGNDMPNSTLSLPYIKLMKKEALYWDYLLAQNKFAAEILPRAFGYKGEVLEFGYPRNDMFTEDDSAERSLMMRHNLGIPDGKKVVLYAPTWRDNVRTEDNGYGFVSFLNVKLALENLGDDYVFLIRGHHNVAQQRFTTTETNVIDVTSYPNINDLIIASDCLVTDYSSVMFDYVVTGKPVYFLVPDLDLYRSKTRGFYFDFDKLPPGPIAVDTDGLTLAIRNQEMVGTTAENYSEFRSTYASQDDGQAAARVYEAVWVQTE